MDKYCRFFVLLLCFISSSNFFAWDEDIIYGEDDRVEASESSYQNLGLFVAAMVQEESLDKFQTLQEKRNLCDGERFGEQRSLSHCSGLLVKGKYIVTASHCVSFWGGLEDGCKKNSWLFDYKISEGEELVDSKKLYSCKKIVEIDRKLDYAVIELKNEVAGRYFSPRFASWLKDEPLITLGFPDGIPMKFSSGKMIKMKDGQEKQYYFNFDTSQGNSGSPIFTEDQDLVGFLKFGKSDYIYNESKGCYETNVCNDNGFHCGEKESIEGEVAFLLRDLPNKSLLKRLIQK